MAGSLGTLAIELAANTARLTSDMGKAVSIVERGANSMRTAFTRLTSIAAGGAIASLAFKAIQVGDSLNKAAIKAGVSGKAISELAYAAKQSDIDLSSLSTSLRRMQTALSEAASGAKAPNQALAALGLTIEEIRGLQPDKQFEILGDRISKLKDPADRARAATELFGRAGADLLPLFEQGAEGIRKAREEAERMGLSFSDQMLKSLAAADDSVKRLKASWEGFAVTMTAKVAPAITQVLNNLTAFATDDALGELKGNIEFLERMKGRSFVSFGSEEFGTGFFTASEGAKKLIELRKRLADMDRKPRTGTRFGAGTLPEAPGFAADVTKDSVADLSEIVVTATRLNAKYLSDLDQQTQLEARREVQAYEKKVAEINVLRQENFISEMEAKKRLAEAEDTFNRESLSNVVVTARKIGQTVKEISEFARQAARNIQDHLAEFLFDPFDKGLKGMLKGFIDTIRQMVAQNAAASILEKIGLGSGGGGLGGFLTGIGSLFGFANGGKFKVGGSGGVDSQLVAFRASPDETVSVTKPGQGMGATVVINNNIDARGATQDAIKALPAILARNNADLEAKIVFRLSRGLYGSPA